MVTYPDNCEHLLIMVIVMVTIDFGDDNCDN